MNSALESLLTRLPHRDPFRFVSQVDGVEPGVSGTGFWRVLGNEPYFAGHFPGAPVVPGVLLVEALAQLAGIVAFARVPGCERSAKLARVDVKFGAPVVPPAQVRLHASTVRSLGGVHVFAVTAESGGVRVADGTVTVAGPRADSPAETQ